MSLKLAVNERTRSNETHAPEQHIHALRQLIEGAFAEQLSHTGYPRVVCELLVLFPFSAVSFLLEQFCEQLVGIGSHSTVFEYLYRLSVHAHSFLGIEYPGSFAGDEICELYYGRARYQQHKSNYAEDDVEHTLDDKVKELRRSEGKSTDADCLVYAEVCDELILGLESDNRFYADMYIDSIIDELSIDLCPDLRRRYSNENISDIILHDIFCWI